MKLVVALAALACAGLPFVASAAEDSGTLNVGLARGASLYVKDINGDVSIVSGPSFSVRYRKHGGTDPAQVRVIGEVVGDQTRICVRYPGDTVDDCSRGSFSSHNDSDVAVDLTIVVPGATRVEASTVNGRLNVHTDGFVRAQNVNGKVTVDAADADQVRTVNGSVDVTLHDARATTPLRVESVNGSLRVMLASAGAYVRASALNGSIDAFNLPVDRPQYGPGAKVDGQVGNGARSVDLKTLNGSISLGKLASG